MKKLTILFAFAAFFVACGNQDNPPAVDTPASEPTTTTAENGNPSYDPNRGEGKFKDVQMADHLDAALAEKGQKIAELKCESCHKMTDEKLVGPGWKGVTTRHQPAWILNFITNTDAMLDKDPKAQAMLEICMVRMPNQNLNDDDAKALLEFMRKNDGVK